MIESFAHKGLKRLFEKDDARGLNLDHVEKITLILTTLDATETVEVMNLPSFRLHKLTGDLKGFWAVTVRANWRIIYPFANGAAADGNLMDYH